MYDDFEVSVYAIKPSPSAPTYQLANCLPHQDLLTCQVYLLILEEIQSISCLPMIDSLISRVQQSPME